jgi:hypothetical protein
MQHRITLDLSTAQLDELLNCIESTLGLNRATPNAKHRPTLIEYAVAESRETPWSVACLRSVYRTLVASWPQPDTSVRVLTDAVILNRAAAHPAEDRLRQVR